MIRRMIIALAVGAIAACSQAQPGSDPVSAIQPLYEPYIQDRNPPSLLDAAPWTAEMRDLLQRERQHQRDGNEPILDFDPLIDGQDWDIDAVSVTLTQPAADGRAEVTATFNNAGEDTRIVYDMVEANGGWRVDNVRTENWSLREILASGGIAVEPAASE